MRTPLLLAALALVAALLLSAEIASAHPGHDAAPDVVFAYDRPDAMTPIARIKGENRYEADVVSHDGLLWLTWLEYIPGKGDQLWVGTRNGDADGEAAVVVETPGDLHRPTLTVAGDGELWLTYEQGRADQWDIVAVRRISGLKFDPPRVISTSPGSDLAHQAIAATDDHGGLWVVWQSDRQGQFDIVLRQIDARRLGAEEVVSLSPRGDWAPDMAMLSDATLYVVWDSFDGESFNVYARRRDAQGWGPRIDVATTPAFEGRAALAVDAADRVLVLWESGGDNWGQPYRTRGMTADADGVGPLHRFRRLHLAVIAGEQVRLLVVPLPQPSLDAALLRRPAGHAVRQLGAFYERGRLAVDADGRVWIAWRHYYVPWLGLENRSHVQSDWAIYARAITADGYSPLLKMSAGQGDGLQRLELAPHGKQLAAVWTTGRTDRRKPIDRGLVLATFTTEAPAANEIALDEPVEKTTAPVVAFAPPAPPKPATVAGKQYELCFGDLHRHTDLSLCRVPLDGTIDDAYRYAAEVARLDFLGITDHSRDLALGSSLSQLWWRSRKQVYRHELDGVFFPFYAYERSHGNTADHNVISLRGDLLRPHTYPVPQFWKELDQDTITIPHQPFRRDTWAYQDDRLRPLLEIYQGCRNAAMEGEAHKALAKGYHLGFIASSDHMSTGVSFACVWSPDRSREAIFRAMQARRTFGANAKIRLVVTAGEHWMGEIFTAATMPAIEVEATGTAPIRSVRFIVDGREALVRSPNQQHVKLSEQLGLTGSHNIYVHLTQSDGNEAWSSPLWITVDKNK